MDRSVPDAIRELFLALPQTEEGESHGSTVFKAAGKMLAHFVINHHGDGRVALWLASPPGVQRLYTELNPKAYFVPPYVGPKGYLGMELNKGLSWKEVSARITEAWEHVVPTAVAAELEGAPEVAPPTVEMGPEDINPLLGAYPQEVLAQLAERCARLPEANCEDALGGADWKAGRKAFMRVGHRHGRLWLMFRVGIEQQSMLAGIPRYRIPPYYGSSGWIELDVQDTIHWDEIEGLMETSYRHFALKRMLKALDGAR